MDKERFIGCWIIDEKDDEARELFGDVMLEFLPDERLIYTIRDAPKHQKIFLTYQIRDGFLVTDQPSHPHEEQTRFSFLNENVLELFHERQKVLYVRVVLNP